MASSLPSQAAESDTVAYATLEISVDTEISILSMVTKFTYTIPSFSVLSVDVRQITFQVLAVDGFVFIFYGFIHVDSPLDLGDRAPFAINLKDYCFVTVSMHMVSHAMYMSLILLVCIPLILGRRSF